MSNTTLALMITGTIFVILFSWVPLLSWVEVLTLHYTLRMEEEVPDLRDDDYSPHLWREAA